MFVQFPNLRVEGLFRLEADEFVVRHEEVTGRGETERRSAYYVVREDRIVREVLV